MSINHNAAYILEYLNARDVAQPGHMWSWYKYKYLAWYKYKYTWELQQVHTMSQLRQYNKKPCKTITYKLNVRQSIGAFERVAVDHARGRLQKQARTGRVFAFEPDVNYACC